MNNTGYISPFFKQRRNVCCSLPGHPWPSLTQITCIYCQPSFKKQRGIIHCFGKRQGRMLCLLWEATHPASKTYREEARKQARNHRLCGERNIAAYCQCASQQLTLHSQVCCPPPRDCISCPLLWWVTSKGVYTSMEWWVRSMRLPLIN